LLAGWLGDTFSLGVTRVLATFFGVVLVAVFPAAFFGADFATALPAFAAVAERAAGAPGSEAILA